MRRLGILLMTQLAGFSAFAGHRCDSSVLRQAQSALGEPALKITLKAPEKEGELLVYSFRVTYEKQNGKVSQLFKVNVTPDDCQFVGPSVAQPDSQKVE